MDPAPVEAVRRRQLSKERSSRAAQRGSRGGLVLVDGGPVGKASGAGPRQSSGTAGPGQGQQHGVADHRLEVDLLADQRIGLALGRVGLEHLGVHLGLGLALDRVEAAAALALPRHPDRAGGRDAALSDSSTRSTCTGVPSGTRLVVSVEPVEVGLDLERPAGARVPEQLGHAHLERPSPAHGRPARLVTTRRPGRRTPRRTRRRSPGPVGGRVGAVGRRRQVERVLLIGRPRPAGWCPAASGGRRRPASWCARARSRSWPASGRRSPRPRGAGGGPRPRRCRSIW